MSQIEAGRDDRRRIDFGRHLFLAAHFEQLHHVYVVVGVEAVGFIERTTHVSTALAVQIEVVRLDRVLFVHVECVFVVFEVACAKRLINTSLNKLNQCQSK